MEKATDQVKKILFWKRILLWIKKWFWDKPISRPKPLVVKDVIDNYVVFMYKDQHICLRKDELPLWNGLSAKGKRQVMLRTRSREKKGLIKFVEVDGKTICIKNQDHGSKAHTGKLSNDKAGSGK